MLVKLSVNFLSNLSIRCHVSKVTYIPTNTNTSTMTMRPESPSKDEHHQPFFADEGEFRAHGVHSVKIKLNGFTILSRDGWVYELEQIDRWQQHKHQCLSPPKADSAG